VPSGAWPAYPVLRRRILRPSMVHARLHEVQPSRSPNRFEVRPDLPIVPPQTQLSPTPTASAPPRLSNGERLGSGRNSLRTNLTARRMLPTTTTMTIVTK